MTRRRDDARPNEDEEEEDDDDDACGSSYFNAIDASNARAIGGSRASPRAASSSSVETLAIDRAGAAWARCGIFYARGADEFERRWVEEEEAGGGD